MQALKKNSIHVHLKPWMEIRGKLQKIETDEHNLYLDIDRTHLVVRREVVEASLIENDLTKNKIGFDIAILRTDIPDKPILIRFIKNEASKK